MEMKNFPTLLTALILLGLSALIPSNTNARDTEYVPGEVLVKFKDGTLAKDINNLHANLKTSKRKELHKLKLHRLKLPKQLSVEEAVSKYKQDPNVEYAEPNYIVHAVATTPGDTSFYRLWGLNNSNDTDIDAPEAWDITTGSDDVIIAVIDSGLAFVDSDLANYHPEFANNIWTNDAEIIGNRIDDDGNGYKDDIYGWDLIDGDGYPLDLNNHGTHVAGTIAAQGNNGLGISGVMWNAQIMPVRFLGLSGSGSTFDAIAAIEYACKNGARVINNSWGGGGYSDILKRTIEGTIGGKWCADALFIFAAGNESSDNNTSPFYPASYNSPNIISVAATDSSDTLAWVSNYGTASVDLGAPGTSIYSTVPQYSYGTPVTVYPPAGTVEDFEGPTGDLSQYGWARGETNFNWAVTAGTGNSGNSLEDSPDDGNYDMGTSVWAYYQTEINSSSKGKRYLLTFDWRGDLDSFDDPNVPGLDVSWLDMIYSTDGTNWDWIDYRTGTQSAFTTYAADYTPVAETFDSFYFGFRIESNDLSDEKDGVYIDNVEMTAQNISITSNFNNYTYANGTSMAAPHVTGVAGLLLAIDPTLTNIELKDIILNTVDPVPGLSGQVLTGGRLNAYKALLSITPPPAAPSDLSATAVSSSRINLSWTDNAANETGFSIQRKTGATGTYSQIASVGANVTSYANTGTNASTTYYYRVHAYNAGGNSSYSNQANATTDAAPVTTTTTTLPAVITSTATGGDGGSSGGCFIATATYGSYLAPEVAVLKQFRDNHLLTNPAGRKFVELYYRHSPPIADIIRENKGLRTATRIMLTPVVMLVAYPNTSLFILFSLFMGLFSSLNFNRKQ